MLSICPQAQQHSEILLPQKLEKSWGRHLLHEEKSLLEHTKKQSGLTIGHPNHQSCSHSHYEHRDLVEFFQDAVPSMVNQHETKCRHRTV
jgi:hypothetical protein